MEELIILYTFVITAQCALGDHVTVTEVDASKHQLH